MSRFVLFALSLLLFHQAKASIGLISPEQAAQIAQEAGSKALILDTRGGYKDYISGHLPNARHINFDTLRATDDKGVPVQYLPVKLTKELLTMAGVDRERTHILYAEGGTGDEILSTTMVAYVLEKYGVKDIKIVDGGLPDYKAKFPLSQEYPKTKRGQLPTKMNTQIGVDVKTVLKKKDQPKVVLLDARPENEYLGNDTVWPRKGHIPGAISLPWRKVMDEKNTHKFRDIAEVRPLFSSLGVTPDKEVIIYCGTSREGSLLRFYLSHLAQFPNVKLYEGSWKEYAALKELPASTEASPINTRR